MSRGTFEVQATTTRPKITVTADGEGVVSHAGSRLLADVADKTTLTDQLSVVLDGLRKPRARHDPGRVLVDMAVAVADGATTISDVAVLADQAALFGPVASDSTCWRLLERLDAAQLGAVARARAAAREVVWAQRAELTGEPFPPARAAGRALPGLVIDLDAKARDLLLRGVAGGAADLLSNRLQRCVSLIPVVDLRGRPVLQLASSVSLDQDRQGDPHHRHAAAVARLGQEVAHRERRGPRFSQGSPGAETRAASRRCRRRRSSAWGEVVTRAVHHAWSGGGRSCRRSDRRGDRGVGTRPGAGGADGRRAG